MIIRASFEATTEEFASKRRGLLEEYDANLYPHVADALKRVGINSWEMPLVEMAMKLFNSLVKAETEEPGPGIEIMREAFEEELRAALQKTTPVPQERFNAQVDRVTRWMSTAIINAATEAAVADDPDESVGLEWVTMEDDKVRDSHREAHGQQVPRGQKFEVGDVKMFYPGEPVGDPANWINCRCVVRPAMLSSLTAAGEPGLKKDGTPPVCEYCKEPATKYVLHSEGMAYVPACDEHLQQAEEDAANCTPPGDEPDPSNIDRIGDYAMTAAGKAEEDREEAEVLDAEDEAQPIPDELAMLQVPWHGVLAPEGVPSGDGRMFGVEALTWRDLPLPIKSMFVDDEGHKGSVITARIDHIFREDGLIKAEGVFDTTPEAYESVRMLAEGMWRGVSVDIDAAELSVADMDENGGMNMVFSKGRICAATLCAIPAFAEAWVKLGTWADDPDHKKPSDVGQNEEVEASVSRETFRPVPPQTKDGPGWITNPDPTEDITNYWVDGRGAAKIRWGQGGDFNRCRSQLAKYVQNPDWLAGLCANLHYRALGIWPGEHKASLQIDENAEAPSVSLVASADVMEDVVSIDYFKNPMLEEPTPITITEDGHIFGHIAEWDTCHIGKYPCVTAPHSNMDYAYFLTGEVRTDAGFVPVGQITLGGGHAPDGISLRAALAHYDNLGTAFADVNCGEDDHGIWVAGLVREGVTKKQLHDMRAASVSGDWRGVMSRGQENLELVAVCAVNVPGFPIPRARAAMDGERQTSLVAAGVLSPDKELDPEKVARRTAMLATAKALRIERIKNQAFGSKGGK